VVADRFLVITRGDRGYTRARAAAPLSTAIEGDGRTIRTTTRQEALMSATDTETGGITGTKDKDYNIIWFTEACLSNALRLENYIADAERENDTELVEFFRRAQAESRKGAEQGKELLASRLGR
jgi:hypothetical protein